MIVTEYLNEGTLVKRYSDAGMLIERDGVRYSEAIDPANIERVYVETDEPIDKPEEEETPESGETSVDAEYAEAGRILLGVTE